MKNTLSKGEWAEIKDLYGGDWASIRELSRIFKIPIWILRWGLNYKNYQDKMKNLALNWRLKNPEKYKLSQKKAHKKWYLKNKLC